MTRDVVRPRARRLRNTGASLLPERLQFAPKLGAGLLTALLTTASAFAQAPAAATPKMRGDGPPPEAQPFSITREDPALDEIVDAHATADIMADGFGLTEGPLWMNEPGAGFLLVGGLLD